VIEGIDWGHSSFYNGASPLKDREILLLDSTLREGAQAPEVSFTTRQMLQIAWMLDYFGIDFVEISPIVSKNYFDACKTMVGAGLSCNVVAHVRALPKDVDVALKCDAKWVAMFQSMSDIHLKYKLRMSREEAIDRMVKAIDYAKAHGLKVRFTMEDASRSDPEFLKFACRKAQEARVDRISLPDTLGVMRPSGMYRMVKLIADEVSTPLDVHCHNDLGLALANSLAGLEAGGSAVHVTIDGIGERVGITSLAEATLALILLYGVKLDVRLEMLKDLSDLLSSYTGLKTPDSKPIVGKNAFRHKAGTHVAAMLRSPSTYELIPPKLVGNRRRIVFGELSGKNSATLLLSLLGLNPSPEETKRLSLGLKELAKGDLFELDLTDVLERRILEADSG